MATDYADLVPVTIAREVIESATATSAVLALARTIPMPAGMVKLPVVSVAPSASFVNPTYGGRKPYVQIEWDTESITPEEIACIVAIPNAFIDDAGFPVWESVRAELAKAVAFTIDDAAINGAGAPASWPTGGLVAAADATTGTGPVEAIDAALSSVEANGFAVNGIIGGTKLMGVMRGLGTGLVVPTAAPPSTIWGLSWKSSPAWDYSNGDELVGDFNYALVGIREDITFDLSSEGVITDSAGKVLVNAFQDDSTLLRCYIRVGFAIGKALPARNSGGTTAVAPFAIADDTTGAGALAATGGGAKTAPPKATSTT